MNKTTVDKSRVEDDSSSGQLLNPIKKSRHLLGDLGNSKFYEEVAAGRLKLVKIGRRSFVTTDELHRYVATLQENAATDSDTGVAETPDEAAA